MQHRAGYVCRHEWGIIISYFTHKCTVSRFGNSPVCPICCSSPHWYQRRDSRLTQQQVGYSVKKKKKKKWNNNWQNFINWFEKKKKLHKTCGCVCRMWFHYARRRQVPSCHPHKDRIVVSLVILTLPFLFTRRRSCLNLINRKIHITLDTMF